MDQLARLLHARGVRRGDRVTLFLDNGIEVVAAVYAALRIGAVFMPVNSLTKQDKLAYLLNDSRASALVTHAVLRGIWQGALTANATVHTCLVADDVVDGSAGTDALTDRCLPYPAANERIEGEDAEPLTIDQDLASIIYTSGSTGDAKGVMLTHLNMVSATRSISSMRRRWTAKSRSDRICRPFPGSSRTDMSRRFVGTSSTKAASRSSSCPVWSVS